MGNLSYVKTPEGIEKKSFEIIEENVDKANFSPKEWNVVRRVIHTTADFDFANLLKFSPGAIEAGLSAMQKGCRIYTDTRMAEAGINKKALKELGCKALCMVDDPQAAEMAKREGITRSMASVMMAAAFPDIKIYVLGNAPTALFKLIELIREGKANPDLIIGVPVGFVGAAESKEELSKLSVPHIITKGQKGGSNIAAAIVNALMYMSLEEKTIKNG
ncbi:MULTISPECIES: precorrin-8X methylmutase [Tepidanaerobacter]|uniref:Precorrin-8X/cobalt-precorrin-8 methylmutase n=1 Tax=Tepidanaerobacter syntrophicus TaxID=224999 RepID=A0A0U9HMK9_9FIRM|nr:MULTISPECIES: precorrin-8X methylmutase [Tepidanaerobacter]GAQ25327.1 precorrin-8X/cobalt-precorrin-8 methylmutase [Tepidanaerobacter syntrophicus]GLI18798.1 precorrin-8X methylmutase [Tepidanaerobacter syntrophicus]